MLNGVKAKWKNGFEAFNNADADLVASEIISIGTAATPKQIVEKAKDDRTELHKCFEWNDTVAADKWRLHQARQVCCHLVIKQAEQSIKDFKEHEETEIRFFVKVDDQSGYKPTILVLRNESEHKALLERAYNELQAFKRKYNALTELQGIFELIP